MKQHTTFMKFFRALEVETQAVNQALACLIFFMIAGLNTLYAQHATQIKYQAVMKSHQLLMDIEIQHIQSESLLALALKETPQNTHYENSYDDWIFYLKDNLTRTKEIHIQRVLNWNTVVRDFTNRLKTLFDFDSDKKLDISESDERLAAMANLKYIKTLIQKRQALSFSWQPAQHARMFNFQEFGKDMLTIYKVQVDTCESYLKIISSFIEIHKIKLDSETAINNQKQAELFQSRNKENLEKLKQLRGEEKVVYLAIKHLESEISKPSPIAESYQPKHSVAGTKLPLSEDAFVIFQDTDRVNRAMLAFAKPSLCDDFEQKVASLASELEKCEKHRHFKSVIEDSKVVFQYLLSRANKEKCPCVDKLQAVQVQYGL